MITFLGMDVDFDGRVSTGIKDLDDGASEQP